MAVAIEPQGPFELARHEATAALEVEFARDSGGGNGGEEALVTFRVGGREEFRVRLTDPEEIRLAREQLRGERSALIPNGRVVRGETGVNDGWSWDIDPASFEWPEVTVEVCDGQPSMVEDGTITSDRYCPWNAEVIDLEPIA